MKPGVWGVVIGSVLTMIIGFSWGGWVTASTAGSDARQQAEAAVTSALVPFCLANAKTDPEGSKKIGELRKLSYSYEQEQFVMTSGWATLPGSQEPNREVADACTSQLLKAAEAKAEAK
jgi:hypothetical protein